MPLFTVRLRVTHAPDGYNWVTISAADAADARRVVAREYGDYWTADAVFEGDKPRQIAVAVCAVCLRPLSADGHCRTEACPRFDATPDEGVRS